MTGRASGVSPEKQRTVNPERFPFGRPPGTRPRSLKQTLSTAATGGRPLWDSPLASGAPLLYKFFLPRPRLHFCPRGASRPRPWSRGLHHWYNLVPANGRWCLATGKVTVGLASHWPRVTDSGFPPTGSRPRSERWAPNYVLLCSMVDFTFTFIHGK